MFRSSNFILEFALLHNYILIELYFILKNHTKLPEIPLERAPRLKPGLEPPLNIFLTAENTPKKDFLKIKTQLKIKPHTKTILTPSNKPSIPHSFFQSALINSSVSYLHSAKLHPKSVSGHVSLFWPIFCLLSGCGFSFYGFCQKVKFWCKTLFKKPALKMAF